VVELDYVHFRVVETLWESADHPWASLTSYQKIGAPYLLAKVSAPRRISFKITSPTSFKSKGMHMPIPLPELVFGSLLDRWNLFAPIAFPPEVRRYAGECLAVSRYKLYSRSVPMKSRGVRMGGMGEITYVSLNYDRYWMSVIQTLAMFALFSGVGAGTTMGLGQVQQIQEKDNRIHSPYSKESEDDESD
jgi:CRISPR-associated endoribonuclease Cas6